MEGGLPSDLRLRFFSVSALAQGEILSSEIISTLDLCWIDAITSPLMPSPPPGPYVLQSLETPAILPGLTLLSCEAYGGGTLLSTPEKGWF